MINTDPRSSSEVLMDALESVETADEVVIVLQEKGAITIKTNCSYRELHWILSQAKHATMNELFGVERNVD